MLNVERECSMVWQRSGGSRKGLQPDPALVRRAILSADGKNLWMVFTDRALNQWGRRGCSVERANAKRAPMAA